MNGVVFAASEVGSARAVLPVCALCYEREVPFVVTDQGYLGRATNPDWGVLRHCPDDPDEMRIFLLDSHASVLVFSVNIKDPMPLRLARVANSINIPTIHVLDYWNGYSLRMKMDGEGMFKPSAYVVPDDFAAQAAVVEGIDPAIVKALGQPAFSDTISCFEKATARNRKDAITSLGLDPEKKTILFISEPVAEDYGSSENENRGFKGYTEKDVISVFYAAVSSYSPDLEVCVLPHPREDAGSLGKLWKALGGETVGRVTPNLRARDLLPFVSAVVGMASTLLYEAWLVGVPVLSLQPGLKLDSLRMMKGREGVMFLEEKNNVIEKAESWLSGIITHTQKRGFRQELQLHQDATERIFKLTRIAMENPVKLTGLENI